jgi:hypothetical protein
LSGDFLIEPEVPVKFFNPTLSAVQRKWIKMYFITMPCAWTLLRAWNRYLKISE